MTICATCISYVIESLNNHRKITGKTRLNILDTVVTNYYFMSVVYNILRALMYYLLT